MYAAHAIAYSYIASVAPRAPKELRSRSQLVARSLHAAPAEGRGKFKLTHWLSIPPVYSDLGIAAAIIREQRRKAPPHSI